MKAKIFYLTMALVLVFSLVVVPAAVAEEVDPPYIYAPASVNLSLYAGGETSSFNLDIAIDWDDVGPREVYTEMRAKSVDPENAADSFTFVFNPAEPFTLGINKTQTVIVTVSAKSGAAEGYYTFKIVANDFYHETPVIGEADGCHVYITVSFDSVMAVVVFEGITKAGVTNATTTETTPCGAIPSGYTAVGSPVDITTTVIYGAVVAGVRYDDSQVDNEANLRLFHCYGDQWEDITTYVDVVNDIVYGEPESLSEFAAGEPAGEPGPGEEEDEGCFIATAAYGTPTAEEIDVLRAFRDQVLLESSLGSQFVEWYYDFSPPLAEFISEHSLLRALVRELVIDPMVSLAELTQGIWGD